MAEHRICDQCKDRDEPVTSENGGTLYRNGTWTADVHTTCKEAWLTANGAADFARLVMTDRTLLLNGLASVEGSRNLKLEPKSLRLGNLELIFDSDEKLERLRIHLPRGDARVYSVREPQERII